MKTLGLLLLALTTVGSAACTKVDTFNCLQSSECVDGIVQGECEPGTLLCSFPDPACPSGKSYGDYAGDQSNVCVGGGPGTTTNTPGTASDTATGTSNGSATGSETSVDPTNTTAVDPTTSASQGTTTDSTITTDPTLTTDPSTTTGGACAALGEQCDNNCCGGPCTVCAQEGVCQAQPAEMGPALCGSSCQVCSPQGECAVAPADQPCALNCDDIVLGAQVVGVATVCNGYATKELMSTCGDGGKCTADPVAAGCAGDMPSVLAQCDTVCVKDASLCVPGAIGVTPADYCYLNAESPDCQTACSKDGLSSDAASCGPDGVCLHTLKPCGLYKCDADNGMCRTKCMADNDCVSNKCMGTKCQQ